MGTTIMTHDELRSWLRGDWALFFSHPQDFEQCEHEAERWRQAMCEAFATTGMRALAAADERLPASGWVTAIGGTSTSLPVLNASDARRVIAVLDDTLQVRRLLTYSPAQPVPALLELLAAAWTLRNAPHRGGRGALARAESRLDPLVQQLWWGAQHATLGVARAVHLDVVLLVACEGLIGIAQQIDRHLVQGVRDGIRRGLQWLGHEPAPEEAAVRSGEHHSLNGGW